MKTPRELLFNRHRSITSKLDTLRVTVVSDLRKAAEPDSFAPRETLMALLWQRLIWPAKRVWLGAATTWCVILLLHASAPSPATLLKADAPRPSLEMITVFQNADSAAVADLQPILRTRYPLPGPRSDNRFSIIQS